MAVIRRKKYRRARAAHLLLLLGRPSVEVPDNPDLMLVTVFVPGPQADEVIRTGCRETPHGEHTAVHRAVGQLDLKRLERAFPEPGRVRLEPEGGEIGLRDLGASARLALGFSPNIFHAIQRGLELRVAGNL